MLKLWVVGMLVALAHVHAHGHAHDHHGHSHDEPPAFKWSKQANLPEDEIMEEDIETIVGHGHAHEHGGHGHDHGGHVHDHGGHGHAHNHGGHGHSHGGHGHSHGGQAKEPAPEEREKLRQNLHAKVICLSSCFFERLLPRYLWINIDYASYFIAIGIVKKFKSITVHPLQSELLEKFKLRSEGPIVIKNTSDTSTLSGRLELMYPDT